MDLDKLRLQLEAALKKSGASQKEFSLHHGISHSTLNKFLKGHLRNPRLSTLLGYERAATTPAKYGWIECKPISEGRT